MRVVSRLLPLVCGLALSAAVLAAPAQYRQPLDDPDYADAQEHVFLRDEVTYVYVTMDPADLQAFLADPYTDVYADCTVRIVNSKIDETYANVGIRPRGNTARDAKKKSWKLSFHEFVPGRRFHGLRKMNVNGVAVDPSISRSMIMYDFFRASGVPASRAHHIWFEINDGNDVSGVFEHSEQVDQVFLQAWFGNDNGRLYKCRHKAEPANLTYRAPGLPATYEAMEAYEEDRAGGDFTLLADFIDFVNHAPAADFRGQLGDWLDVDSFLRAQAADMVAGQWDGYWIGANNFYLYENLETGRLVYIPWDLDHCYGMDYLFFPIIGNFGTDFAVKAYTGWGNRGFGINGNAPPPLMDRALQVPEYDLTLQRYARELNASAFHEAVQFPAIAKIESLISSLAFTGSFSGPTMDDGITNAKHRGSYDRPTSYSLFSNPDTWGVRPFVSKRVDYVDRNYPVAPPLPRVFVNEAVAVNDGVLADPAGEFDDFVEIYNDEDVAIDLGDWYLSDRPGSSREWAFPAGTTIGPKDFLIVWCDDDAGQPGLHAPFKLSGSGESVHLWMPASASHVQVDSLVFPDLASDEAFGRFPDGAPTTERLFLASPLTPNDAGGLGMRSEGFCAGPVSIHVGGATPGGSVAIASAAALGSFTIPAGYPCAGTVLDLDPATVALAATVPADSVGKLQLGTTLLPAQCGNVFVQAVDLATCAVSEVVGF